MASQHNPQDLKLWLKDALSQEQLTDFNVEILGGTEQGDGYMGDIVFVHVAGKTASDNTKSLDLVLKCSKQVQALREMFPVKETFENEIHVYDRVFPAFKQFEIEKGIKSPFDSVPRYLGSLISDNVEVVVLQNLKVLGYKMHERKKPLNLDHLKLLLREYGRWHAISGAMQQQKPEVFAGLLGGLKDMWKRVNECMNLSAMLAASIDELYELIKQDVNENVGQKLLDLKNDIVYITTKLVYDRSHFSVICHGDGWNNNFMFKYEESDENKPLKVALLDWQIAIFANPVTDLSYFLYTCISKESLNVFEDLLKEYHASFSDHVRNLGSDPEQIFPYSKLLEDWKVFAKFGFLKASMVLKLAVIEKDEAQEMVKSLESNAELHAAGSVYKLKDQSKLKERFLAIIEHAVDYGVI